MDTGEGLTESDHLQPWASALDAWLECPTSCDLGGFNRALRLTTALFPESLLLVASTPPLYCPKPLPGPGLIGFSCLSWGRRVSQPGRLPGDMEPRRAAPGAHGSGPRVAAGSGDGRGARVPLAGALGAELQELARRFGPEAAAGLVPLVVQALELLEKAAVGPAPDSVSHGALPQPPAWASGGWPGSCGLPSCRYPHSRRNSSCGGCERRTSASAESCALDHKGECGLAGLRGRGSAGLPLSRARR